MLSRPAAKAACVMLRILEAALLVFATALVTYTISRITDPARFSDIMQGAFIAAFGNAIVGIFHDLFG